MKSIKNLLVCTFLLTISIVSCKKDDAIKTKKEILEMKSWRFSSQKENDIAIVMIECDKDDIIKFKSDGTYTFNPTTIKCNAQETIETGTWSLSADEKKLVIDGYSLTIVELTESRLIFSDKTGNLTTESTFNSF